MIAESQAHQTPSPPAISINPKLFKPKIERERGCCWDPSIEVADATLLRLESRKNNADHHNADVGENPADSLTWSGYSPPTKMPHPYPLHWFFVHKGYVLRNSLYASKNHLVHRKVHEAPRMFTWKSWISHCCPSCRIPLNYQTFEFFDCQHFTPLPQKSACTIGVRDGKRWEPLQ